MRDSGESQRRVATDLVRVSVESLPQSSLHRNPHAPTLCYHSTRVGVRLVRGVLQCR